MTSPGNGRTTTRGAIRDVAIAILAGEPAGLRYSDLKERVAAVLPSVKPNTLHGSLHHFTQNLPREISKPSKGRYRHSAPVRGDPGVPNVDLTSSARRSARERPTAKRSVRELAISTLAGAPQGLRFSELQARVAAGLPGVNSNTLRGSLWDFTQNLPREVVKPSRGFYRHAKFGASSDDDTAPGKSETPPELVAATTRRPARQTSPQRAQEAHAAIRESDFYKPFADWLVNELEECTRAIPLGGSVFRDKWGTPDIIGVREPRKSDIVKFPTEIVSAEVKTDGTALITAFGQACAYRLFSHKSYLVVPNISSEEDVARLDVLARLFGIGLILFDERAPNEPRFSIRVRASKHEPDGFYVNRCLRYVERQLFE